MATKLIEPVYQFDGGAIVPTKAPGSNSTQAASTAYADAAVSAAVKQGVRTTVGAACNGAPGNSDSSGATHTSATYLTPMLVLRDMEQVTFTFVNPTATALTGCTHTVQTPDGVVHRSKVAGGTSWTIPANGQVTTDVLTDLVVTAGMFLAHECFVSSATANSWASNVAIGAGSWNGYGGAQYGSDQTGTSPGTGFDNVARYGVGPTAISGLCARPTRSWAIFGDSIAYSTGDTGYNSPGVPNSCATRALQMVGVPFVQTAQPSIYAPTTIDANRMLAVAGCTDAILQWGTNNLAASQGNQSLATFQAIVLSEGTQLKNAGFQRVLASTIVPRTSGTAGSQTADASTSVRQSYNAWLRGGAPIVNGVAVAVGTAGALLAGQAGHPLQDYLEIAAIVESPQGSGLWNASYFNDGIHPNAAGHLALMAAIPPAMLGDSELKYGLPALGRGLTASSYLMRFVGGWNNTGAPSGQYYQKGDFGFDSAQRLWVCSAQGNPGTWVSWPTPTSVSGLWGNGQDGAVTLDGTTNFAGFSTRSGSVYTLTRELHATTLVINSGVTLKTAGVPVFAQVSITNNGTIDNSAGNAAGTAAGTTAGLVMWNATAGTAGTTGNGSAPGTSGGIGTANSGAGGAGGTGTAGSVGFGLTTATGLYLHPQPLLTGGFAWAGAIRVAVGGAQGSSGGGDGTNKGGASGGGGGIIAMLSPSISNTGTISATGGNGGTPTVGNAGGGGGGSGGVIAAYTSTGGWSNTGTTTVTGGTGGAGVGTGAAGGNGGAGSVITSAFS